MDTTTDSSDPSDPLSARDLENLRLAARNPHFRTLARQLAREETPSPQVAAALRLASAKDPQRVALSYLRAATDDAQLRQVLSAFLGDELPAEFQRSLQIALSDSPQRAALSYLRAATEDAQLRQVLSAFLADELPAEFQRSLQIALSDSPQRAALSYLRAATEDAQLRQVLTHFSEEDPSARRSLWLRLLRSPAYLEDLMGTLADTGWMQDERFAKAYDAGSAISVWGPKIRWRMYVLCHCAAHARRLQGDFVECGTDRGGSARVMLDYVGADGFAGRNFYLFDTFNGLVDAQLTPAEQELERLKDGRYPQVLDQVRANFAAEDFVRIVPGEVPRTLDQFQGGPVALLHIDMNAALPEAAALDYFWPHLVPGAPVIFDDYGFPFAAEQRRALDEVAARLGTSILTLPTGQGLMWR